MLDTVDLFNDLSSDEKSEVLSASRTVRFQPDQVIYTPDDLCDSLCIVLKGRLRIAKVLPSGREQTINYIEKNQIFGEALAFAGRKCASHVFAEEDSEVLSIPKKAILYAFKNKRFLFSYLKSISEKTLNLSYIIELLSLSTVKKKLASYLLELSLEKGSNSFELPHTKKTLANLFGSTREAVSRNFSELRKDGIIFMPDRNSVEIKSSKQLEKILFD
ncbi:MAG: Crp/Fnr family transcriptional regulator [Mesotoga sp.]|uniref:Crp/Fnr family transcriptional regulator n=1 Tax=Mesotoga sp. H07.pep.5.3 TaxID=1421003 RepID=UPI000C18620E|nr:Crp/Fnr family transcriptional regulator [Mesotoga sp. H07.pep.5.3]PIJ60407.1 Crp/Fnr family transcriptional regulator [Mesotoga sp. H07.pep.5.3]